MIELTNSNILRWIEHLSWYQYLGEVLALIFYFSSFFIRLQEKKKSQSLNNFLRSTSLLIAFAFIAIPFIIKGEF
ncbi:hypothetical protein [Prochlorococcus marinus]|uniref:hypothetical protein n=1 Tax=Prochlorococcus marinus TaxID=1219 RepID=UPI0022B54A19|nr:hypothetical protein [Prochlorococcus marinus]